MGVQPIMSNGNATDAVLRKASAGMIITGAALSALGTALAGFELAKSTRRWMTEQEGTPGDIALHKAHQTLGAAAAAREAWHHSHDQAS